MRYGPPISMLLLSTVFWLGGCASGGGSPADSPAPAEPSDPADRPVSVQLEEALSTETLGPEAQRLIATLDVELGADLNVHLAALAEDTAAAVPARRQALRLLGRRNAAAQARTFHRGLLAEEVELRLAAVEALGDLLSILDDRAVSLLRRALRDADPRVQAQALEALGGHDAEVLRDYLGRRPPSELGALAEELLRVAQSRGAPLAPADTLPDALERRTPDGARVVFRAQRRWPAWDAATGELAVAPADGPPVLLADGVEVVANVVPAFLSPGARAVVFEVDRTIRVHELETGEEWSVGAGIAPRTLPFTDEFVFLRERTDERTVEGDRTELYYDVVRADFAEGRTDVLGTLRADARMPVRGNYSPVRWMRVRQRGERFFLEGEGIDSFQLPDPFAMTTTEP